MPRRLPNDSSPVLISILGLLGLILSAQSQSSAELWFNGRPLT